MSLKKKIVWLPYDFDTALGINNEGLLVFGYELEDTDLTAAGKEIYNGQNSVLWNNIRDAFIDELNTMYRNLRSTGALSYEKVEQMFEEHQSKWPERLVNEDSKFKYIDPGVENGNWSNLGMLQGLKTEQRKWWGYNRFRYIDSKRNAGDALADFITLRGYAKSNITVRPYADIYPTVKYGSYVVSTRGKRGTTTTLVCPLDALNDTEIYIYSSSQLASVGDLSGLMVGYADFSMATRLQEIKLGDSSSSYNNGNLLQLTLGNNVLLKKLDVRNCSGLGNTDQEGHTQTSVDISGCEIIEEVYFEGTKIQGLTLPNGGNLKKLHLPETMANITVMNQKALTEFTMEGSDYSNVRTLRVENSSSVIPVMDILNDMSAGSRVRLIGFTTAAEGSTDAEKIASVEAFYTKLESMRGLDEQGRDEATAQVSGTITGLGTITGAWLASMKARFPDIEIEATTVTSVLTFKNYDGSSTLYTRDFDNGVLRTGQTIPSAPARSATAQYSYTPIGWNTRTDQQTADPDCVTDVWADRTVYAAYTWTVRTYTVTWKNGSTTLETDTNVPYGTMPHYDGATPTQDGRAAIGWEPEISAVTGNITYSALFTPKYNVNFYNGSTLLQTVSVYEGSNATYTGTTPTNPEQTAFLGWSRTSGAKTADPTALQNITANTNVYAVFESALEVAEITDSWETIMSRVNAGTAADYYSVGNYKALDLGTEGIVNMQIVGTMTDELYSGSGYAQLSWLSMELLATSHRMNPDLVTIYSYPEVDSWTASGNTWTSQNRYNVSTAKATWTITATEAGTLSIFYKTSNSNASRNRITTLTVNGTAVATNYTNTAGTTHTVEVAAGDTVTVYCEFDQLAVYNYYGTVTFSSTGAFTVAADVQKAPNRHVDGFTAGTGSIGGFGYPSEMKTYLNETVYPLIPTTVRSNIKAVKKYTSIYDTTGTSVKNQASSETVWIPSYREIFGGTNYESQGPVYTVVYPDAASRIKMKAGATSASVWWLRSASFSSYFFGVYSSGASSIINAGASYGVALGFST